MDKFNLDNVDCNKLYKIHTGHMVFDESDDDSTESEAETDKLYDANEPPLYTYEELQANLGNFESRNDTIQQTNIEYYEVVNKGTSKSKEMNQKLKKLLLPDYCLICDADLANPGNAQSHYKSNRHKDNLTYWKYHEKNTSELSVKNIVTKNTTETVKIQIHCKICNVTDYSVDHYNSTLHQSNVEAFCFVCNIKTMSKKQLAEHVKGSKHIMNVEKMRNIDKPKIVASTSVDKKDTFKLSEEINRKLEKLILSDYCHVCDADLANPGNAQSHYKSNRHKDELQNWRDWELHILKLATKNVVATKPSNKLVLDVTEHTTKTFKVNCHICNITDSSEDHYNSTLHQGNLEAYCFVCNLKTMSKEQLTEHVKGVKHVRNLNQIQNINRFETAATTFVDKKGSGASNSSISGYSDNEVDQSSPSLTYREEYMSLKSEMLNQMEEFIDNIYFSNRIPLKIALKYIQKYNQELVNMKTGSNYVINKEECALNLDDNGNQGSFEDSDDDWDGSSGNTYEADSNGYTPTLYFNDYRCLPKNINSCLSPYSERPKIPRGYSFSKLLFGGAVGLFLIYLLKYR